MITSCKCTADLEPLVAPGSGVHDRFDFAVERYNGSGNNLKADVTVKNPCGSAVVDRAASQPLFAAGRAFNDKSSHYNPLLQPNDHFVPLVFETFGAMHSMVCTVVSAFGARMANYPPEQATWAAPTFCSYWYQRLSCALWRENAIMIDLTARATRSLSCTGLMGDDLASDIDQDATIQDQ
jgi:hypothetical protein